MRGLVWVTAILAMLWGGWWFAGSRGVEAAARGWFADMARDGRQAGYEALEVRGFPNRFDLTVTGPALADPARGIGWRAPFAQVFAMSWKPWHVIAALPGDQVFTVAGQEFALDAERLMASLLLVPGPDLAVSEAVVEGDALGLRPVAPDGASLDGATDLGAARVVMSLRAEGARAEGGHDYRLGLAVAEMAVDPSLAAAAGLAGIIEDVTLDAMVTLSEPLDRHAGQTTPALRAFDLTEARVVWGELKLFARGEMAADELGFAAGNISVRVENWRLLPPLLVASGAIAPGFEPSLMRGLEILAGQGEDPAVLVVPLVAKDGRMAFGPLPLGPAPRMGN
ncbi:DUF2125 domain-containing protein [Tabrizicola sp.]|uniref:DUF2125 domain-containing protein n=1 Tax=Tabrizicola sp. TaxID=2005166 RepID=UPI003D2871BD